MTVLTMMARKKQNHVTTNQNDSQSQPIQDSNEIKKIIKI